MRVFPKNLEGFSKKQSPEKGRKKDDVLFFFGLVMSDDLEVRYANIANPERRWPTNTFTKMEVFCSVVKEA